MSTPDDDKIIDFLTCRNKQTDEEVVDILTNDEHFGDRDLVRRRLANIKKVLDEYPLIKCEDYYDTLRWAMILGESMLHKMRSNEVMTLIINTGGE